MENESQEAGEDFYSQHLAKTAWKNGGTVIYPFPASTGPLHGSHIRLLAESGIILLPPECFQISKDWLALV
jgi:hypothetical protein